MAADLAVQKHEGSAPRSPASLEKSTSALMTEYAYRVFSDERGGVIELRRLSDGLQKSFVVAAAGRQVESLSALEWFMSSLTDSQCESFFAGPRPERKKRPA